MDDPKIALHDPPEALLGSPPGRVCVILGLLGLVGALAFYWGAVLHFPLHQTKWLDLRPYPDATEYFAQARSLARSGQPVIEIGEARLYSRFPPGYPALMLPWLHWPFSEPVLAPFRANQAIGLFLLLGIYLFYLALRRPLAGGLAAATLATLPAFVTFSHSALSDLAGAGSSLLAFGLMFLGLKKQRRSYIYASAVVLGLSILIRTPLVFLAPLLIGMAFFPAVESRGRWFFHCVLCLLVFAAAASPYFFLNYLEFGSALRSGYDFWVPGLKLFSNHNAPRQLKLLFGLATATWPEYGAANVYGTGCYIVPPFVLLGIIGIPLGRGSHFFYSALLSVGAFVFVLLTYLFVDGRFYLPIFFVMVPLVALPVEAAVLKICSGSWSISTSAVLVLFILSCLGYPSQSGYKPKGNHVQAWDVFRYWNYPSRSLDYDAEESFRLRFATSPGIVFSDINPVYLNALLPEGFVAAPIDGEHAYNKIAVWRFGPPEARALAEKGVAHSLPVYALITAGNKEALQTARLPVPDGFHWQKIIASSGNATTVMKLVRILNDD